MNLVPTWDLFIIILFVVVIAYSFIIGRGQTSRVVIASYMAILTADGLGNLVYRGLVGPNPQLQIFSIQGSESSIIMLKLAFFVTLIVLLALKGGFDADIGATEQKFLNMVVTGTLGFLSAGLIVSAILVYLSGGSFLPGIGFTPNDLAVSIYQQSPLARLLIDNSSLWFSLPALAFIASSIFSE